MTDDAPLIVTATGPLADTVIDIPSRSSVIFPEDELRSTIPDMPGTPVTNSVSANIVGQTIDAAYDDGKVVFEAEIYDAEETEKIEGGMLDITPQYRHDPIPDNGNVTRVQNLLIEGVFLAPDIIDEFGGITDTRWRKQSLSEYLDQ